MRKAIAAIVLFAVLFSVSTPSSAAGLASLSSIKYTKTGSQDKITINTSNYRGYNVYWVKDPDRLVVDIPNNKVNVRGSRTISINSKLLSNIRFSQYSKTSARVVFDTKGKVPYSVNASGVSLTFTLGKASAASRGDTEDRPAPQLQRLFFSFRDSGDRIVIPGSDHDGYNIFRLTDPDRVVIDVPNLTLSADQQLITVNSKYTRNIRTAPVNSTITRVVMDTKGQPQYRLEKTSDSLAIVLEEPTIKNMTYHNAGNAASLVLNGVKLTELAPSDIPESADFETTEEGAGLRQLYSGGYDETNIRYAMTFSSSLADIGSGKLQINDGIMDSIEVTTNPAAQTTSIIFNAKSRLVYEANTNPESNITEISILKPYAEKDRLVVIDSGHGGSDPGAQYGDLNEKDLNLKIALKVNEILKSKGINTYMTRDDDIFVPLQNRADIANNLNATLFLSIHNNAYYSREYGTETLYYPGDSGSSFARIVQDTLINALGTYDRGIIERPNLVVLYATNMPAVIAEVAFLTNKDDRARLMDDGFIQKSAEALADAVVKALG